MSFDQHKELQLMEALESEPEISQADLAAQVGVAVGTVNWYIKRWSAKGYVKVKRIGRWRWRYLLTPQGVAEKMDLANRYFQASLQVYRKARVESLRLLNEVRSAGYQEIYLAGEGDIAEICYLTCLELGLRVAEEKSPVLPTLSVEGLKMALELPGIDGNGS